MEDLQEDNLLYQFKSQLEESWKVFIKECSQDVNYNFSFIHF